MIKYIASDLDGTLLPDNGTEIDPHVFDLILKLKEKGIHFIAASGRQYQSMRRLFAPIRDEISYISENGSLCTYKGKVICRGLIERSLGLEIIDAGREYSRTARPCHSLLSCETRHYTDSKDEYYIHHMRDVIHNEIEAVDDLHDINEPFLKFAFCDFKGIEKLAPFLKARFSPRIQVAAASAYWVDFIAPNANKGIALSRLLSSLGIDPKDGIAFGDQHNDIDMLKLAGTSYAVETAAPGVAGYADYVTASVPGILETILKSLE